MYLFSLVSLRVQLRPPRASAEGHRQAAGHSPRRPLTERENLRQPLESKTIAIRSLVYIYINSFSQSNQHLGDKKANSAPKWARGAEFWPQSGRNCGEKIFGKGRATFAKWLTPYSGHDEPKTSQKMLLLL